MSAGRHAKKLPHAPEEGARPHDEIAAEASARAYRRVQHLYEISKLLTRFEGASTTVPATLSILARALPLRTALVLLEAPDHLRTQTIAWHAEGVGASRLRAAEVHARVAYRDLTGSTAAAAVSPSGEPDATSAPPGGPREEAEERGSVVLLPLVVDRRPIFGVLRIEAAARLEEPDLVFVNAAVNQLAIALDRQAMIDARQAAAEAERAAARAAEERIRDQLELTRAVTGSIGEGVLALDLEERITFFNAAAERLLGWTAAEALGRRVQEVLRVQHQDGTPVLDGERPALRAIRAGDLAQSDEYLFSRRGRAPFHVSCTCAPLRRAGQISGAVLVFQDIMGVKQAEKAQRLFAEVSTALASSLDQRETIEAIARFSVPALADLHFVDLIGEDGRVERLEPGSAGPSGPAPGIARIAAEPGRETPQEKVLRTGEPLLLPEITDAAARGERSGTVMVVPLLARGETFGTLTFVAAESGRRYSDADLVVAQEVARRAAMALKNVRLYERAQRAIRTRDDFLAVVSHDLRNPLSSILTAAALLLTAFPASEQGALDKRKAELILRAAQRMLRIIGDLLDVAAIEAGRLSVETRRCTAGALVRSAVEMEHGLASAKPLVLESAFPAGGRFEVLCDRERVLQVFANLLGNAIKFTRPGGAITVRAEPRDGDALFSVTDTGPGIPPEQIPHVFDRFWRAKETARMGTGLGLTIAKGLVEAQGGRIWVESRVGAGTTFFFTLPLAPPSLAGG
jgi:PAS domain S-box-containing protein